jgi:hypothetical protein
MIRFFGQNLIMRRWGRVKLCSTKDYDIWSITALGARTLVHHTISYGDTLHIAPLTTVLYSHCLLL